MELREKIINSLYRTAGTVANTRSIIFSKYKALCGGCSMHNLLWNSDLSACNSEKQYCIHIGEGRGLLERSKDVVLITRPNIYCIFSTIHQTSHLILMRALRDGH